MEVICINGKFKDLSKYGFKISVPVEGRIYTLKEVIVNKNGKIGITLEEINNIVTINNVEINFSVERFTTLLGKSINIEEYEDRVQPNEIHYLRY